MINHNWRRLLLDVRVFRDAELVCDRLQKRGRTLVFSRLVSLTLVMLTMDNMTMVTIFDHDW